MEQLSLVLPVVSSTKKCTKCGIEKDRSDFHKNSSTRDGLHSRCKPCKRADDIDYIKRNTEKIKEGKKRHYQENRDKVLASCQDYVNRNKDKVRERKAAWGQKNKDRLKAKRVVYYEENKERLLANQREAYRKNPEKEKLYQKEYAKKNAEYIRAYRKKFREENKEKIKEQRRTSRKKNAETIKKRQAEYYKNNIDLIREKAKKYREEKSDQLKAQQKRWKEANPERISALRRNYKAKRKSAEGSHNDEDIIKLYKQQNGLCAACKVILQTSGKEKYHVDHIIPLSKGGTNWPDNLQILCMSCNTSKGDKLPEEWEIYKASINQTSLTA